jgi:hypothetical protein
MPRFSPRVVAHSDGVDVKALQRSNGSGHRSQAPLGLASNDVSYIAADKLAAIHALTGMNKRPVKDSADRVVNRAEVARPKDNAVRPAPVPNAPAGATTARRSGARPISMHALLQQPSPSSPYESCVPVVAVRGVDTDLVAHAPPQWNDAFYKRRSRDTYKSDKAATSAKAPPAGVASSARRSNSGKSCSYGAGGGVKESLQMVKNVRATRAPQPSRKVRSFNHAPDSARKNFMGGVIFKDSTPRTKNAQIAACAQQSPVTKKAAKSSKARLDERRYSPRPHNQDYMRPLPNNGWVVDSETCSTSEKSCEKDMASINEGDLSQGDKVIDMADLGDVAVVLSQNEDAHTRPDHESTDICDTSSTNDYSDEGSSSYGSGDHFVDDDEILLDNEALDMAESGNIAVVLSQNNDERSRLRRERELHALHLNKANLNALSDMPSKISHRRLSEGANIRISNNEIKGHRPFRCDANGGLTDEEEIEMGNVSNEINNSMSISRGLVNRNLRSSKDKLDVCTPSKGASRARMASTPLYNSTSKLGCHGPHSGEGLCSSDGGSEVHSLTCAPADDPDKLRKDCTPFERPHGAAIEVTHAVDAEKSVKAASDRYKLKSRSKRPESEIDPLPIKSKWVERWAQMAQNKQN